MIERFVDWVRSTALPTWLDRGYDRHAGQFHERLSFAGRPVAVPHRAMVQARQIYAFARAASLGWLEEGATAAEQAMDRLHSRFAETAHGATSFAYSVHPASGAVHDTRRDSYTHAFVLLALAHLYEFTGNPSLLTLADQVCRFIETKLVDAVHGGVIDALPSDANAQKRQNPQMHLLEAYLSLEGVAPGRGFGERAEALIGLFRRKLFDRDARILVEHFAADWGPHADCEQAGLWEPGHHYEWVWLLNQADHLLGLRSPDADALRATAGAHGIAPNGLIYDALDRHYAIVRSGHRLWPHTEAIKAATVSHISGEEGARDFANTMARGLMTHFLDQPFAGGWIDHRNADLTPRSQYVPASSLYHLFLAATEASSAFGLAGPGSRARANAAK